MTNELAIAAGRGQSRMVRALSFAVLLLLTLVVNSCGSVVEGDGVYTLYRNSVTGSTMRIHVATFDSADGIAYNQENCGQAQLLFQAQPDVQTQFWCEKGRYKK